MKISKITTDSLLENLSDCSVTPTTVLGEWIRARKLAPGRTPASATTLYNDYVKWYTNTYAAAPKPISMQLWGRLMQQHFKRGRGKSGMIYYVSRKGTGKVVEKVLKEMGG